MDSLQTFLNAYGLAAVFGLMLVKSIGVPIPIPADVIMLAVAARAAQGGLVMWQAFTVILVALVAGGLVQFRLAGGPGRLLLYRFGRYLGLTAARLDAASASVQKGGVFGIGFAILTPGIRAAAVAASGLAGVPLSIFVPGLVLGSTLFLSLHFFLGAAIAPLLSTLGQTAPVELLLGLLVAAVILGIGAWLVIRRRQRPGASSGEVFAEALEAWHEATCPVCLTLGAASGAAPLGRASST